MAQGASDRVHHGRGGVQQPEVVRWYERIRKRHALLPAPVHSSKDHSVTKCSAGLHMVRILLVI